jgi:hypothetical protein
LIRVDEKLRQLAKCKCNRVFDFLPFFCFITYDWKLEKCSMGDGEMRYILTQVEPDIFSQQKLIGLGPCGA